jgi:hypothetical protein
MQNQLPQPQSDKPFLEIVGDAFKEALPLWWDVLLQKYSPKIYSDLKAAKQLEPYLLPEGKPILDFFVGYSNVIGAAQVGVGVARALQLSNPPYAKPIRKKKTRRHS